MSDVNVLFLLQNQDKLFLSKSKEWVDGTDLSTLYRSPHKDEAVNVLVEVNSKDIYQRIHCLQCEAGSNKQPIINAADMPEPLPKEKVAPVDTDDSKHEDNGDEQLDSGQTTASEQEAETPHLAMAE